jgi:hypothetical protein
MGSRLAVWLNGHLTVKFITIGELELGLALGATSAAENSAPRTTNGKTAIAINAHLIFMG